MSNHREMEHADGFELLQIDVHGVNGEGFLHQTPAKTFSKRLPRKFRRNLVVIFHCSMSPTSFHCEKNSKSKAFMEKLRCPMSIQRLILLSAWKYLVRDNFFGIPEQQVDAEELVLEGIARIDGSKHFAFYCESNHRVKNVTLPRSLQTLTFGYFFNQSLENVTLPRSLQTLTFGKCFNQSLENVTLPDSLQSLTLGDGFNESLENITLPRSLQSLTFGDDFDQSLENVTLPDSLQTLTFGKCFNQSLENVTLPGSLQSLTFGDDFDQSLENVTLPRSLQHLTFGMFGAGFNQSPLCPAVCNT